jgi:elongation factor Ts
MKCKKALEAAAGDLEKAKEVLRKKGLKTAENKSQRAAQAGIIASYIHNNKRVGVLLEIRSETDFVARSDDFSQLAHELCLQIAASAPKFVSAKEIPSKFIEKERRIYQAQFSESGKPKELVKSIVEGKIKKLKKEITLLEQPFIKNPDKCVDDLVKEYINKLGENIVIQRFSRYQI